MRKKIITWDLGATKCTAGLIEFDEASYDFICKKHVTVKLSKTGSLEDLINHLETGLNFSIPEADAICVGAAGQYDGQYLLHANQYPYPMPFGQIAKTKHWPAFAIIHDYASVICATFTSYMNNPQNIRRLNDCKAAHAGRRVALGVGTGLGLKDGVLFESGDFWLGKNEIGHIGITAPPYAPSHLLDRHQALIQFLQKKCLDKKTQAITFEQILTGQGTANLYQFFYPDQSELTPEEVGHILREGKAPQVLETFAWYLGLFIGTVQLAFMPEGGVWITGGVTLNHLDAFDCPDFFAGIHASPAYRNQRETYPLGVLCNHEHALIGSGYYAAKRLL
jgi:glucokinase